MNKVEGYELLRGIVKDEIRHKDYKRVKDLADLYYKLKTGDRIADLLHKIETRVTEKEFEQIQAIYKSIVPATLNSTKLPFQKAARKKPIVRLVDFVNNADKKKAELDNFINTYWGDKSLTEYLEYAYIDYNYIDPNAFLITEFDEFDPKKETAKPYPFVATSEEAIMFDYNNEILEYLVVKLPIKYKVGDSEIEGSKYTMYLGQDTIVFSEVGGLSNRPEEAKSVIELSGRYYAVYYYQPKNSKVPAIRFGYIRDEQTQGRTFVSVFHAVIHFLEKTLKIDSELDLSTSMVAFPQRFAYATPCKNQGCNKGYMPDGKECDICHGTGIEEPHKGTQDVVYLTLPRTKDEMIDLEGLLVYKHPPIELLAFQKEYLEYLKKSVHAMMFNADLYTRAEVSVTATEKLLETDNMNDTLYPFARQYSAIWEFVVLDIATFTDLSEGIILQHKFPEDFKFKSLNELMSELKAAKDAGASTSTIAAIEDDINEILYSDRPDALKEIRVKNLINPFRGYSDANIRFIISQGNTTRYARTLYENMEAIFQELEIENENPWIYDMEIKKIRELVKQKVDNYIAIIDEEKQKQFDQYVTQNGSE